MMPCLSISVDTALPIPATSIQPINRSRTTRTRVMTPTGLLTVGAHTITPAPSKAAELAVFRTFVMAHLLTADREQAEAASLEALDAWNPETESGEALLRHGVDAALRRTRGRVLLDPIESGAARSYLPAELQAVLKLPPSHRRCFAL